MNRRLALLTLVGTVALLTSFAVARPADAAYPAVNVVDTYAGDGTLAFGGDGGSALLAQINDPHGIAVAPDGTIYFADSGNFRIRKIDPAGIISTVAGAGTSGNTGDGGPATSATFAFLLTISLDPVSNTLYVADAHNNRVRRIDLDTGTIAAFAGTGTVGFLGDGGSATSARLRRPQGVAVAPDGSVVIADTNNCRIRKVSAGIITTIAGSGVCDSTGNGLAAGSASFYFPRRVHVDGDGNVFVTDASISSNDDDTIRRIDAVSNIVERVAGGGTVTSGSGAAVDIKLGNVSDLVTDAFGNLYIGSLHRVFRVDLATGLSSPFAGTGDFGYSGDGGNALDAQFNNVNAVALLGDTLLISDGTNARIRAVTPAAPASDNTVAGDINTVIGNGGTGYSGDGGDPIAATLNNPRAVAVAANGTIYFADTANFRIRKVEGGIITTLVGTGTSGNSGNGGPGTSAEIGSIASIGLDAAGDNLYFVDTTECLVRRVDLSSSSTNGHVFAYAGTTCGFPDGNTGPAVSANLGFVEGLAVAPNGDVYISDTFFCSIRRIRTDGIIEGFAGIDCATSGDGGLAANAGFSPRRLAFDSASNLFLVDGASNRIRRIDASTSIITSVAGGGATTPGSGTATSMDIGFPVELAIDGNDLFVANQLRVYRVDLSSNFLSIFAGNGTFGGGGDGGPAIDAQFADIAGLARRGGDLIISDGILQRIRAVTPTAPAAGNVVVTDCADPALAGLTVIAGDLVVENVPACEAISLPSLTEVGGDVTITGNDAAAVVSMAELGTVAGDVTISDNGSAAEINLDALTNVGGAISLSDNTSAATIDLGALLSAGEVTISGNTAATTVDLGALTDVGGAIALSDNTAAATVDLGALVSAGEVTISDNSSSTVVSLGSLEDVRGSVELESAGATIDMGGATVAGDVTLTGIGADSVSATTGGGSTEVTVLGGTAAMHVLLPDGTFEQPVAFTIERQPDGSAEEGTTADGAPAEIDPLAGYRFSFAVPTLNLDARLSFTVDLSQLDADTRAALLAGVADGSATLVVKGDEAGAGYQALALCTGTQTPAADGCVTVVPLDLAGGPPAPGAEPAFVRFEGVAGHFSTWAVALVEPQDSTPPVLTPTVAGTLGNDGWYTSDVSVSWTVEDSESAITQQSGCGSQTVSADTAGVTFTCEATSAGGTATQSVTIKRDATAPTIAGTRDPAANASGWNNGDVTVSFVCADALSGVASCSAPSIVSTEGANQSVSGTATDVAGNQATATVGGINIDKTAPSCTASASPNRLWPPNHKLVTVNVSVAISDSLSGAAGYTLLSATSNEPDDGPDDGNTVNDIQRFELGTADTSGELRAERSGSGSGRIYTLTYQVTDLAGNSATCNAQVAVPLD